MENINIIRITTVSNTTKAGDINVYTEYYSKVKSGMDYL